VEHLQCVGDTVAETAAAAGCGHPSIRPITYSPPHSGGGGRRPRVATARWFNDAADAADERNEL